MSEREIMFRCLGKIWSLPLSRVAEVVEKPFLFPLAGPLPSLREAINFHGRIVPVLDLGTFMENRGTRGSALLVLDHATADLAVRIDEVVDITRCTDDGEGTQLLPVEELLEQLEKKIMEEHTYGHSLVAG